MQMDPATGKIRCFDIAAKRWVQKQGIDYTEGVKRGSISPTGPTEEVVGSEGAILVCPEEVQDYLNKGYKYKEKPKPAPVGAGPVEQESNEPPYNFMVHDMNTLRTFARDAGLTGVSGMTKPELINALDESGFIPTADEDEIEDEDEDEVEEETEDDED